MANKRYMSVGSSSYGYAAPESAPRPYERPQPRYQSSSQSGSTSLSAQTEERSLPLPQWALQLQTSTSGLRTHPTDYVATKAYVSQTLESIFLILNSMGSVFGDDDRDRFGKHRQSWQDVFNRIDDGAAPPSNGGSGGNSTRNPAPGGTNGDGVNGRMPNQPKNESAHRAEEQQTRPNSKAHGQSHEDQRQREKENAGFFENVFEKLCDVTAGWVLYISEKIENISVAIRPVVKAVARESVEILKSGWDWFKKDGVKIVLSIVFGGYPGGDGCSDFAPA